MITEVIDLELYRVDVSRNDEELDGIISSHLRRIEQGKDVWNAWAEEFERTIIKKYSLSLLESLRSKYLIDLSNTIFEKQVDFSGFKFPVDVKFDHSNFKYESSFVDVKFCGNASLAYTEFYGIVWFDNIIFERNAYFSSCLFTNIAYFSGAIFLGMACFNDSKFEGEAYFSESQFQNENGADVSFSGAKFCEHSSFIYVKVNEFLIRPFDFRQLNYKIAPLVEFIPSNLRKFKKSIQVCENKNILGELEDFYEDCESRFRELKRLADENNNHKKSLEFYACELYCQRMATDGLKNYKNWVNYFYDWFSGYGLSLKKPLGWWFVISILCVSLQSFMDKSYYISWSDSGKERVSYYIAPSLPPFIQDSRYQAELRYRLYPEILDTEKAQGAIPLENRLIRGIQTFFTFLSIFFFGLGLRNLFKIK